RGALDAADHRGRGIDELVEAVETGELRTSKVVSARDVQPRSHPRRHDLLRGVPDLLDQTGLEVPERSPDDPGLDITEHATATEEVEAEAVEPHLLPLLERVRGEEEGGTDVADLPCCGLHHLTWIHACMLAERPHS